MPHTLEKQFIAEGPALERLRLAMFQRRTFPVGRVRFSRSEGSNLIPLCLLIAAFPKHSLGQAERAKASTAGDKKMRHRCKRQ